MTIDEMRKRNQLLERVAGLLEVLLVKYDSIPEKGGDLNDIIIEVAELILKELENE